MSETQAKWLERLDAARTLVVLAAQLEVEQGRATLQVEVAVGVLAKVQSDEPVARDAE